MGFWSDLALGMAKGAIDALQKADGPPGKPPFGKKADSGGDDSDEKGPPGKDGPPAPPPPVLPDRKIPEPVVGDGPTLAAPPIEDRGAGMVPKTIAQLEKAASEPKGIFWDPFAIIDALGYKDKPSAITFNTLHQMRWQCPIVHAIIKTRADQVFAFSRQQENKYTTGFRIRPRDPKQKPTPATERESQSIERWMLSTGATDQPQNRDSFGDFLKKLTKDSLTYDQACFEIVPARNGKPAEFYAHDARTIRIADTTRLFLDPEDMDVTRHVQIYDGLVNARFKSGELAFGIRNPTSDIRNQGYGEAELEMLITTVTALLFGWQYNEKIFTNGTAAKGIINFKGTIPDAQLEAFKRHWYYMTSGIENAFKTPIVNSDELQYVSLQNTNRDMEFSAWFDFLIKIACAIFGMDPLEINFKYGDSGAGKQMFESANQSKLTASKDKGLKHLLVWLEDLLNKFLVWPLNPDFVIEFVGLDARSVQEDADLNAKLVKTSLTIDEIRAMDDRPPLPNGLGAIILDPNYIAHLTMAQQQAQIDQAKAAGAQPGEAAPTPDENGEMPDDGEDGGGEVPQGDAGDDLPDIPDASAKDADDPLADDGDMEKSETGGLRFFIEV